MKTSHNIVDMTVARMLIDIGFEESSEMKAENAISNISARKTLKYTVLLLTAI